MEHSSETRKLAFTWLSAAGALAVGFSLFLYFSDYYLSNSKGEAENAKVLEVMRRSQSSLPGRPTDERMLRAVPNSGAGER
ncbi:MAG: hypothetical protein J5J00_10085 [Deltaproteobacteria bacterium]|nr:hypothetical protein [Deltaproteobacteria bacterium]